MPHGSAVTNVLVFGMRILLFSPVSVLSLIHLPFSILPKRHCKDSAVRVHLSSTTSVCLSAGFGARGTRDWLLVHAGRLSELAFSAARLEDGQSGSHSLKHSTAPPPHFPTSPAMSTYLQSTCTSQQGRPSIRSIWTGTQPPTENLPRPGKKRRSSSSCRLSPPSFLSAHGPKWHDLRIGGASLPPSPSRSSTGELASRLR